MAQNGDRFSLTDDGCILGDLESSGFDPTKAKRRATLETIIAGFGIQIEGDRLKAEASPHTLGQKVHALVQAMLAVNDLFVLAQPRVEVYFWEDVKGFLHENDIRYTPKVKVTGKSGYDQSIDFVIPKSRNRPERLIQAINSPNRNAIAGSCSH